MTEVQDSLSISASTNMPNFDISTNWMGAEPRCWPPDSPGWSCGKQIDERSDNYRQMHRAREILTPDAQNYDWYNPRIHFARIHRSHLDIHGPFEHQMRILAELAARNSANPFRDDLSSVYVPIHELQVPIIRQKFPDVEILSCDISLQGLAQASIRYVENHLELWPV